VSDGGWWFQLVVGCVVVCVVGCVLLLCRLRNVFGMGRCEDGERRMVLVCVCGGRGRVCESMLPLPVYDAIRCYTLYTLSTLLTACHVVDTRVLSLTPAGWRINIKK
jgi:hypothetical protein